MSEFGTRRTRCGWPRLPFGYPAPSPSAFADAGCELLSHTRNSRGTTQQTRAPHFIWEGSTAAGIFQSNSTSRRPNTYKPMETSQSASRAERGRFKTRAFRSHSLYLSAGRGRRGRPLSRRCSVRAPLAIRRLPRASFVRERILPRGFRRSHYLDDVVGRALLSSCIEGLTRAVTHQTNARTGRSVRLWALSEGLGQWGRARLPGGRAGCRLGSGLLAQQFHDILPGSRPSIGRKR